MFYSNSRAVTAATPLFALCLSAAVAHAHAVCGDRTFPATLGIDDPGVGDELALPTISLSPVDAADQHRNVSATFNYTKTIFPGFGLSVGDGPRWATTTSQFQGGYGWGDLTIGAKYNFLCMPDHEFMASAGLGVDLGRTYTSGMGNNFNTYSPVLDVGKGFGDLPKSLNAFRPLAVTAALSANFPGQSNTNGDPNPTVLNWGFTVQYSLPYYNSHVGEIGGDFLKHLIPIAEVTFSRPISNYAPGTNVTTGTVQPGLIYAADKWQFAVEAVIPLNRASGSNVGVVGELHYFFDDIFPGTLGKPIFGARP